ncbi:hypothetical protein GGI24_002729 [Coemansia furcata]|nr:hypothetical protein GGI24_002729 [Coemansia furcata]
MMQEEVTRTLNSLSLGGGGGGGGAGNRSSVVDRVKWIEQKHGGAPSAQAAQPRARLRLPKHFVSAQADSVGADASLSPKTQAAGLLSPSDHGAARLPLAMTQQKSAAKTPTLARRTTEQMPSPVISEASTVAIDEGFDEPLVVKAEVLPAFVPAAQPVFVPAAKPEEVPEEEEPEAAPAEAPIEVPSPSAPLPPAAAKIDDVAPVESQPAKPLIEPAPVEPVRVVDLIEPEAAEDPVEEAPMVERSISQTDLLHARMPSNCSEVSNISGVTDTSNLTDPEDPVHVTSTRGSAGHSDNGEEEAGATPPACEAAELVQQPPQYATLPRSTKFAGSKSPGLGGTRNRPQQAPRRYDRTPANQRPESSSSMQSRNSEDSGRSAFGRPEAQRMKEQPVARSFSTRPAYPKSAEAGTQESSSSSSLLARLNDLSATRPNAQDMVSNRSAPKFAKRSQYYGPSSQDDSGNTSSSGGPRNRAQRRFRYVSELTVMDGPNNDCLPYLVLAHINSRTLTALHANHLYERDWKILVCGYSKAPAVFTCLKTLLLHIVDSEYNTEWDKTNDIVMFPNLSTLEVTGSYPFTDDLLFRGNGSTLQTLYLPFKTMADNTLGELGILERKGVTKMKKIRFGDVTERDKIIVKRNGRGLVARQLYRILDVTTSLRLGDDGINNDVYLSIISTPSVTNIRHLDIRQLTYHHDHVISIIRALPNLASFTVDLTYYSEHGPVPDNYDRASELYSMYYPLGSNFRILCVPSMPEYSGRDIAEEVIRIAIVCKNPVQLHVPPDKRDMFRSTVSRAIASSEFAPYADSLRHLI